ncbi:hypothetical protein [Enterococcus sp. JM9B]|uniref:hypothetical protein n=1 Tax=Enterococcus sp. JM9B TaxID=1857216 RepID=UPI0013749EAB|nr:hypothetical protein [Enterococcus sp. JM9B]KAF1300132.1 hypothetical protein BAU16_12865 [Enterococcus sp. JM9B]
MQKTERVMATIQYRSLSKKMIQRHTQDWFVLIRLLYEPIYMKIAEESYTQFSLIRCRETIEQLGTHEDFSIIVGNGTNESTFYLFEGELLEKHIIQRKIFEEKRELFLNYVETQAHQKGLFASIRSYDEYLYHNTEKIEQRLLFETQEEVDELPKRKNFRGEVIVDCNQFSGYDVNYRGFWLTSCWRLYFHTSYHQIIPLPLFADIQQVERVQQIDELVIIELYKDPFRWDESANANYQRLFRDQIGIDQLAWDNGVGIFREPFVEYAFNGNMIQTVQYQNDRLQPIEKKKASHFVTRTYDIVRRHYQEKRVKGELNARAYFPWVDEQGMKMMNYLVLNPEYAIDEGFSAYMYYIRNYLEINVCDENYPEFKAILTIYIPDDYLKKIPFKKLKETMTDIRFSRLRQRKGKSFFDLKKGKNHLRVVFMNYSTFEQLETRGLGG